jgi:hypothetical protein
MNKFFYSHLLVIDSLFSKLGDLDLTDEQKKELEDIAHVHIHQTIVDAILSELTETDKKKFLELLAYGDDEKIWEHLNDKVEKIEDKITEAAEGVKKDLALDIKKIKQS